jgi:excisionase family DNA binding protein
VSNLIGVEDTARRLGISVWTVYRWARAGRLISVRLGRRRLFAEEDLQELVRTARQPALRAALQSPRVDIPEVREERQS